MPDLHEVLAKAAQTHGFVTLADVAVIAASDRLRQLLVRCGGCRFVCAAQDVTHLCACIAAGGDYVRDISFPVSDPIWRKPPPPKLPDTVGNEAAGYPAPPFHQNKS